MTQATILWCIRGSAFFAAVLLATFFVWRWREQYSKQQRQVMWLLLVVPFVSGGFYTVAYLLGGAYCALCLARTKHTTGKLNIYLNDTGISVLVVSFSYLITIIWSENRGMAPIGAIRYGVLPLYVLLLMQCQKQELADIWRVIPIGGAAMVMLGFPLQYWDITAELVAPEGSFAGFFEYANTFALYLLAGLVVLLTRREYTWRDLIQGLLLLFGLFLSGSRTSFLLMLLVIAAVCIHRRNRKMTLLLLGAVLGGILLTAGIAWKMGAFSGSRYLTISLQDSSVMLRLLYDRDALTMIAAHPFGLGYMGYKALQGSVETWTYSVSFVHNELLQLLLDIGWVPTLLMVISLIRAFFTKKAGFFNRLLLTVIVCHCMMDFDLQYLTIWLILLPLLELHSGKQMAWSGSPVLPEAAVTAALLAGIWLGTGEILYYMGYQDACLRLVPFYTDALEQRLTQVETTEELDALADQVLALSPHSSIAYSAKANAAFAEGRISDMMEAKEQAISCGRFYIEEYTDYFDKLYEAMLMFSAQGDDASASICGEKLLKIPEQIDMVRANSAPLLLGTTWYQAQLELPEAYQEILEVITEE